jgi:hypothetical protein
MQITKFPLWVCALALCGGVTLHAQDNAAQAAARAALLQKMQELEGNPPPPTPAPAPIQSAPAVSAPAAVSPTTIAPAEVVTPTPAATTVPATPTPAPAPIEVAPTGDNSNQTAARAAMQQKLQELDGNSAPAPQTSVAPVSKVVSSTATAEQPIVAPALPINMTKEQRLNSLLSQYKADQLTPQEYYEKRAAILAEP